MQLKALSVTSKPFECFILRQDRRTGYSVGVGFTFHHFCPFRQSTFNRSLASFSSRKPLTLSLTLPHTQHWHNVNAPSGVKRVSAMRAGIGFLFPRQTEESLSIWCFLCRLRPFSPYRHICAVVDQVLELNGAKVAFTPGFYVCFASPIIRNMLMPETKNIVRMILGLSTPPLEASSDSIHQQ